MGNSEEEEKRIREYLKKVDKDYYRPDIKVRKAISGEVIDTDRDPASRYTEVRIRTKYKDSCTHIYYLYNLF